MSRLLQLPAEIRIAIYEYAMVPNTGKEARAGSYQYLLDGQAPESLELAHAKAPPLLRTNRQIRGEALPVFFQANAFVVTSLSGYPARMDCRTMEWLETIDHCNCAIRLQFDGYGRSKPVPAASLVLRDGQLTLVDVRETYDACERQARERIAGLNEAMAKHRGRRVTMADMVVVAYCFFHVKHVNGLCKHLSGDRRCNRNVGPPILTQPSTWKFSW